MQSHENLFQAESGSIRSCSYFRIHFFHFFFFVGAERRYMIVNKILHYNHLFPGIYFRKGGSYVNRFRENLAEGSPIVVRGRRTGVKCESQAGSFARVNATIGMIDTRCRVFKIAG